MAVDDADAMVPADVTKAAGDGSCGGKMRCAACDQVPWAKPGANESVP